MRYMTQGLLAAGRTIRNRMLKKGIPEKFLSARLYCRNERGILEWKNGDQISDEQLDRIYREVDSDETLHGSTQRDAKLFELVSQYRTMEYKCNECGHEVENIDGMLTGIAK